MIWSTDIAVFYFVGFICAKSLGLSSLGIAVIGAAIALTLFFIDKRIIDATLWLPFPLRVLLPLPTVRRISSDGKESCQRRGKYDSQKAFWNSHLVFANFNMTKMEANGFTMTMAPAVESIYGDDIEGKKAAYARHQSFFNTHVAAFNFIAVQRRALEKDCHDGKVPGETIDAIKASLMGPTAGMFDSIFFNCHKNVIGAGIAIGLCSATSGTFIFILLYGISQSRSNGSC